MMNRDLELIEEYKDISKTNKPKIAPYYGDMFIDVEMEYLMRKDLQQRIDKAIEFLDKVREENGNEIGQVNYETLIEILGGKE